MNNILLDSDFLGLPIQTQEFAKIICKFGFSRSHIHGLFVFLGLYAGTPRTQEETKEVAENMQSFIPIDRTKNIDKEIGDFYNGYEYILNEFYFRFGFKIEFREIIVGNLKPMSIIKSVENGNLDDSINGIEKLQDASRLYWSLIENLGNSTVERDKSLVDAFQCGIFQMQLYAQSDVKGSQQFAILLLHSLPLVIGQVFASMKSNNLDYFSGLLNIQVPLFYLMNSMSQKYAEQMWGFQSALFYREKKPMEGIEEKSLPDWHKWVLDHTKNFDIEYPRGLSPLSESGVTLMRLPLWGQDVDNFSAVDRYIHETWGYDSSNLRNYLELLEYKACLIHVVYSSLTSNRELIH